MHVLVPSSWTVHQTHVLLVQIEHDIRAVLPNENRVHSPLVGLDVTLSFTVF
jgi:hypothetical protein